MHVGGVLVFDGHEPTHEELIGQIESRLHLVPRYRQRLAFVPLQQGRPVWVDDPHFNPEYHIRHTALPRPGTEAELKRLAGRLFSQELDRSKDRKSTRLNSSHTVISYAGFCLQKKTIKLIQASAVLDLTEDDFDFLTSNKVWIATDRSRARRCVEACVYGMLDFVVYHGFTARV